MSTDLIILPYHKLLTSMAGDVKLNPVYFWLY